MAETDTRKISITFLAVTGMHTNRIKVAITKDGKVVDSHVTEISLGQKKSFPIRLEHPQQTG